ncbi:MAG: hypothetical protein U9N57_10340 [Pseudomonadota bacterium]|nr:hypothetical protein [Pseudomonadota bacterium]
MNNKYYSVLEQILLSGATFLINLYLLYSLPKADYGVFAIFYSYLILALGVQIAVISTPMVVEFSSLENKTKVLIASLRLIIKLIIFISLIIYLVSYLIYGVDGVLLGLSFSFAVAATLLREFARTKYIIENDLFKSLFISSVFTVLLFSLFVITYFLEIKVTLIYAFLFIGLASFLVSFDLIKLYRGKNSKKIQKIVLRRLFPHSQWALPGVFTIWIQNNAFLTIVSFRGGVELTAEIAAARLFIMPYISAFSGYLRPKVAEFSINKSKACLLYPAVKIAMQQFALGGFIATIFYFANKSDLLNNNYFNGFFADYSNVMGLAVFWALFAGISMGRGVLTSLVQASKLFKLLFLINLVSVAVVLFGLLFSPVSTLAHMSIVFLMVGEALIFVLVILYYIYFGERCVSRH